MSDAIAKLKKAAPAIPSGSIGASKVGTHEWNTAAELGEACSAAGYELFGEGFRGG